jgi:hypothetical protein
MTRITLPLDVEELIVELSPLIAKNISPIDTIRTALFEMKKEFLLSDRYLNLNNPNSPYYAKLTLVEEKDLEQGLQDVENGNFKSGSFKDAKKWLESD